MTSPLPAYLAAVIRERIAVLREASGLDEAQVPQRLTAYPVTRRQRDGRQPEATSPRFPNPRHDNTRSGS